MTAILCGGMGHEQTWQAVLPEDIFFGNQDNVERRFLDWPVPASTTSPRSVATAPEVAPGLNPFRQAGRGVPAVSPEDLKTSPARVEKEAGLRYGPQVYRTLHSGRGPRGGLLQR